MVATSYKEKPAVLEGEVLPPSVGSSCVLKRGLRLLSCEDYRLLSGDPAVAVAGLMLMTGIRHCRQPLPHPWSVIGRGAVVVATRRLERRLRRARLSA